MDAPLLHRSIVLLHRARRRMHCMHVSRPRGRCDEGKARSHASACHVGSGHWFVLLTGAADQARTALRGAPDRTGETFWKAVGRATHPARAPGPSRGAVRAAGLGRCRRRRRRDEDKWSRSEAHASSVERRARPPASTWLRHQILLARTHASRASVRDFFSFQTKKTYSLRSYLRS